MTEIIPSNLLEHNALRKARPPGLRRWLEAMKAAWKRVPCTGELSEWLRRDIGLSEDDVKSHADRIDEIRRKYSGHI